MIRWDAKTIPGRIVRLPLRLIPPSAILPVVSGPLKGLKWVVGSAPHGAWLGTLEHHAPRRFAAKLSRGMAVWDVGASVGLYTLCAARWI